MSLLHQGGQEQKPFSERSNNLNSVSNLHSSNQTIRCQADQSQFKGDMTKSW